MKHIYITLALVLGVLAGCKNERKDAQAEVKRIFQIDSVDENTGLQRMQVSRINQEISCKGKKYQLSIVRAPSDELPYVKSDMGLFADNTIQVKITRENASVLYEKTFTKKDFSAYLTEKYMTNSVLEGLVFDDVRTEEEKEITLAASVSYPMTDLYVPFILVVSQDGKLSIAKDENMGEMTFLEEDENEDKE